MIRKASYFFIAALLGVLVGHKVFVAIDEKLPMLIDRELALNVNGASSSSLYEARVGPYLAAVEFNDIESIEQAIQNLASLPVSSERDARLEALLLRYLDLDSESAVRFAAGFPLDVRLIGVMFGAWASIDSASAFAALGEVSDYSLRRNMALHLAEEFAYDLTTIEQLAALVDEGATVGFVVDALEGLAASEPMLAFAKAVELQQPTHRLNAAERVASAWAQFDAPAALRRISEISNPVLRNVCNGIVMAEWMASDPEASVQYLVSSDGRRLLNALSQDSLSTIARRLALHRPDDALIVAESVGPRNFLGQEIRRTVLQHVVQSDLAGAISDFESLPDGPDRIELARHIGVAMAQESPESALEWAEGIDNQQSSISARSGVIVEFARSDFLSVLDMASNNDEIAVTLARLLTGTQSARYLAGMSSEELGSVFEELVYGGEAQQGIAGAIAQAWSSSDQEGAWSWLLGQEGVGNADLVRLMAQGVANSGTPIPQQRIYELPIDIRTEWITSFVAEYAQAEPQAAAGWLRGFQSDSSYDELASSIVESLVASTDPRAPVFPRAAAYIVDSMQNVSAETMAAVASNWAHDEPLEAVNWALGQAASEARSAGVASSVGSWTIKDRDAARDWSLTLPRGALRDQALAANLLQGIASSGGIDSTILDEFSSPEVTKAVLGQRNTLAALSWVGSRDPGLAQELLDTYITDESARQEVLKRIADFQELGFQVPRDAVLDVY